MLCKPILRMFMLSLAILSGMLDGLAQVPSIQFNIYNDQTAGAPALGALGGNLYVAWRANNSTNTLWMTRTTDGYTVPLSANFSGLTLGSDPSIAGDITQQLVQVAFKSASNDTLWVCSIQPPLSSSSQLGCTNFPSVHLVGSPSIMNYYPGFGNPNSYLFVAFETSAGDPNGSNHLGVVMLTNIPGTVNTVLKMHIFPTMIGAPPAITGFYDGVAPNHSLSVVFQSNDDSHFLVAQAIDWNLDDASPATVLTSIAVGSSPSICAHGVGSGTGPSLVVAHQANDPGNHLWYASLYETTSGTSAPLTTAYNIYQTAMDTNTTSASPAIACWVPSSGPNANKDTITVAFKANDTGNELWMGTQ